MKKSRLTAIILSFAALLSVAACAVTPADVVTSATPESFYRKTVQFPGNREARVGPETDTPLFTLCYYSPMNIEAYEADSNDGAFDGKLFSLYDICTNDENETDMGSIGFNVLSGTAPETGGKSADIFAEILADTGYDSGIITNEWTDADTHIALASQGSDKVITAYNLTKRVYIVLHFDEGRVSDALYKQIASGVKIVDFIPSHKPEE